MKKSSNSPLTGVGGIVALFFVLGAIALIIDGWTGAGILILLIVGAVAYLLFKGKESRKADDGGAASNSRAQAGKTQASTPAPQMVCPNCGKKYPLGQVYCEECGALLKES